MSLCITGQSRWKNHIPQGTIFTITLPVTHNYAVNDEKQDEAEIREKAVDEVSDTTDTHKTSLLIVEDNDDFRNFLINCLKGTYQVFDAPNGKEALEILAHQSIQIVISDVMMPEMDGMELCRKNKDRHPLFSYPCNSTNGTHSRRT